MYAHLANRWDAIRDSFWFVPAIMSSGAVGLAIACASLERPLESIFVEFVPWVEVTTSAARSSLAAIGGAMVSIAGIVFSVMLVTLSITSSQYGSRLLRTFMSDRVTQFALGMLVGTSLFAMLALAAIPDSPDGKETANVSVIVGLVLAIASMAVLIGFIHHVASLIQAPNVVAAVADDLRDSFDRLFPQAAREEMNLTSTEDVILPEADSGRTVPSNKEGYLQGVDYDTLVQLAESHSLFIQVYVKPGNFIEENQVLIEVWPSQENHEGELTTAAEEIAEDVEDLEHRVNESLITGRRRTPRQDAECALEELVEVAVRALSPGINDPFTAIACIDRLGAAMGRVAERKMPDPLIRDGEGIPRILTRGTEFSDLMDAAFNQIRQNGSQVVAVAIRMLQALTRIASHVSTEEQHASVQRHADLLQREFRQHVAQPEDGDDFQRRFDQLIEMLETRPTKG